VVGGAVLQSSGGTRRRQQGRRQGSKAPAGQQRTRWLSVEIKMRRTLSLQAAGGQGAQHAGSL
jgi:hypothetical protein